MNYLYNEIKALHYLALVQHLYSVALISIAMATVECLPDDDVDGLAGVVPAGAI